MKTTEHIAGEDKKIEYGFDWKTQQFFFKEKNTPKVYCSAMELLEKTEGLNIPEEDRGALLLGIPL